MTLNTISMPMTPPLNYIILYPTAFSIPSLGMFPLNLGSLTFILSQGTSILSVPRILKKFVTPHRRVKTNEGKGGNW